MATLSTPSRVRHRINVEETDISDEIITEFIEDSQASIESYAGQSFAESDSLFGTARTICTELASCKSLIHFLNLPGAGISYTVDELRIDKSDYRSNKVSLLRLIWARADDLMPLLKPQSPVLPQSSTA
jgi:hypothetical protein